VDKTQTDSAAFLNELPPMDFFFRVFCLDGQLVLGLASGLEAFSREPPCDSIGALAYRQTPETSGMAWEFLSYYPRLPSRCLRGLLNAKEQEGTNCKYLAFEVH
jgi:hypothetical protein